MSTTLEQHPSAPENPALPPPPSVAPEHSEGAGRIATAAPEPTWTKERIELVRKTVCPKGIGADEFELFMAQCMRSGLDPLLKEAFCVARNKKVSAKGSPDKWEQHFEFQPSEAGMLARAERFPDFIGCQASAVYAEDEILINQGKGEVVHTFNPAKRKGALVGAWARIVRQGKLPVVVWLDFAGYVQPTPLWSKIPTTMIEKCARVGALRKAYPSVFGGLYVREELPPEEFADSTPPPSAPRQEQKPREERPAQQPTKATPPADPEKVHSTVVAFGPYKGKTASELSDAELNATIDLAHEKLTAEPRAKWAKSMQTNLSILEAELELRFKVPTTETLAPEAASNG